MGRETRKSGNFVVMTMPELHRIEGADTMLLPERFTYPFCYEPHGLTRLAAERVTEYLSGRYAHHDALEQGKMLGVLVALDSEGRLGYLAAYSGEVAGLEKDRYFVPPVYDLNERGGVFKRGEARITALNRVIEWLDRFAPMAIARERLARMAASHEREERAFRERMVANKAQRAARREEGALSAEQEQRLIRESQFEKAELRRMRRRHEEERRPLEVMLNEHRGRILRLKQQRKQMSEALQRRIFGLFEMLNGRGERKTLPEIFSEYDQTHGGSGDALPPAGAGECAAPRLLQFAYSKGLKPVCMGEFWWGASPVGEEREKGKFYPACHHKCMPILSFMLQGLDVEPNPLAADCALPLSVVWEDEWLVAVNKPAGLASVPGVAHTDSALLRLQKMYPQARRLMLAHRLDQATSGLLLVAKDEVTGALMHRQFERGDVRKTYVALLCGNVAADEGEVSLPLGADYHDRPRQKVDSERGKEARTSYRVLRRFARHVLVEFTPHTGRTHQLRVHSASSQGLRAAIAGDTLYGGQTTVPAAVAEILTRDYGMSRRGAAGIWLQSQSLRFTHPMTGEEVNIALKKASP